MTIGITIGGELMVINRELEALIYRLRSQEMAKIQCYGIEIVVRILEEGSKIALSTPVFLGENFIPPSVRECLHAHPSFKSNFLQTFLTIDENTFTIHLNYLGDCNISDQACLKEILEEFSWLAQEWRQYLDEHGKNDLIHVKV